MHAALIVAAALASTPGSKESTAAVHVLVAGSIEGDTFRAFEAYIGVTVLYLLVVTAISQVALRTLRGGIVDPAMRY